MQGVEQELFPGLVRKPPVTIAEFLAKAAIIKKALDMRTRQYDCRSTTDYVDVQAHRADDLRKTIRTVVREEMLQES